MSNDGFDQVTIELTGAQVARVVRPVAEGRSAMAALFSGLVNLRALAASVRTSGDGRHLSHSTLRALVVLAALPADGSYRARKGVTERVGLPPSTTHRYVATWMAVGLLEQQAGSRRYRLCPGALINADDGGSPGPR